MLLRQHGVFAKSIGHIEEYIVITVDAIRQPQRFCTEVIGIYYLIGHETAYSHARINKNAV
jgi:hypothetical protein